MPYVCLWPVFITNIDSDKTNIEYRLFTVWLSSQETVNIEGPREAWGAMHARPWPFCTMSEAGYDELIRDVVGRRNHRFCMKIHFTIEKPLSATACCVHSHRQSSPLGACMFGKRSGYKKCVNRCISTIATSFSGHNKADAPAGKLDSHAFNECIGNWSNTMLFPRQPS